MSYNPENHSELGQKAKTEFDAGNYYEAAQLYRELAKDKGVFSA